MTKMPKKMETKTQKSWRSVRRGPKTATRVGTWVLLWWFRCRCRPCACCVAAVASSASASCLLTSSVFLLLSCCSPRSFAGARVQVMVVVVVVEVVYEEQRGQSSICRGGLPSPCSQTARLAFVSLSFLGPSCRGSTHTNCQPYRSGCVHGQRRGRVEGPCAGSACTTEEERGKELALALHTSVPRLVSSL
jgi:hypothetical protein